MPIKPLLVHKLKSRLFNPYTVAFLIYAIGITFLSLVRIDSSNQSILRFEGADKLVHFLFYLGFTFLLALSFKGSLQYNLTFKSQLVIALIAITYSGIIEFLQGYLTIYRSTELGDFIANFVGVIFGLISLKVLNPIFNTMKNPK
jgi:VanZ family protein